MKNRMLKIGLLTASLCSLTTIAQAEITINIINSTTKPAEFSLMVPRTKIYSNLSDGKIASKSTEQFSSDQILPTCNKKRWRCSKFKVVVQKWGSYVVFVACPKIYNSRRSKSVWYKLVGNDSAHLFCRRVNKPRPKLN